MRRLALALALLLPFLIAPTSGSQAQTAFPGASSQTEEPAAEASDGLPADSARALIRAIEDPESRQALIDLLNAAAAKAEGTPQGRADGETGIRTPTQLAAETSGEVDAGPAETEKVALTLSEYAQSIAETASRLANQIFGSFRGLTAVATGEISVNWAKFSEAATRLAVVALVTFMAFYAVRLVARRIFSAVARVAAGRSLLGTVLALVVTSLIDEVAVVFAWAAGYVFALTTGETAFININQSLFLNAFLIVETIKVVLRMLLCPRHGELRLLPIRQPVANGLYWWAAFLVSLVGYGLLLVVPIVNLNVSFFAGRGLRVLIALAAAVTLILVVLRRRHEGARAINRFGHRLGAFGQGAAAVFARLWHVFAVLYILAFVAIWLSRPGDALPFMMGATLRTLVALVVAALVMTLAARVIGGGIALPDDLKARLPMLESRLSHLVPVMLKVVRVALVIAVVITVLDAWQILDVSGWLSGPAGSRFVQGLVAAALIGLVAIVAWLAISSWVDYRLNPDFGKVPTARERTLLSLFRNAATIAIVLFGSMIALSEIGVDIGPLLAGAGVLGLAIGFGAQKLVQDIITGIFIQFENAMNEGDVVTLAGVTGTVEKLTVRSVSLRDLDGVFHIIPFSSVDAVSNFMRGYGYHRAEIGVAYRENIADVKAQMQVAFDRLLETEHGPKILAPLEMHGVTAFADSAIVVRARIKTRPGDQWAIGRAYNEIIKEVFDEAGIEIPFPQQTVWFGEDRSGAAPPLRVRRENGPAAEPPAESPPFVGTTR